MKKKSTSKSAFFNLRILTASAFCLLGIAVALFAQGNRTKSVQQNNRSNRSQDAPGTQKPDVCKWSARFVRIRIYGICLTSRHGAKLTKRVHDPLSAPEHRRPTAGDSVVAMDAKVDEGTFPADGNNAAANYDI